MNEDNTYYLFIDESGDHGLKRIDPNYPVLVICGILIRKSRYPVVKGRINELKQRIFKRTTIVLHSSDLRKKTKDFAALNNPELNSRFNEEFANLVVECPYTIFSSAIRKENYIKYGSNLSTGIYEAALSFVIERVIYHISSYGSKQGSLKLILESRGQKEDDKLKTYLNYIIKNGMKYIPAERMAKHNIEYVFLDKRMNNSGLQLADMLAYPIARHVINAFDSHPMFKLMRAKFCTKYDGTIYGYGMKIY